MATLTRVQSQAAPFAGPGLSRLDVELKRLKCYSVSRRSLPSPLNGRGFRCIELLPRRDSNLALPKSLPRESPRAHSSCGHAKKTLTILHRKAPVFAAVDWAMKFVGHCRHLDCRTSTLQDLAWNEGLEYHQSCGTPRCSSYPSY